MEEKIYIRVVTNAKQNSIVEKEDGTYLVRVSTVPEKGKANKKVIALIAKHFGVSLSAVEIVQGQKQRRKCVTIDI